MANRATTRRPRVRRHRDRRRRRRAARRDRGAGQGVSAALVCKSLLGKAHTVMAEGGIAAALGNVWPEDNWQVHFRDTMRGGKMLNNWRMAQLHAQEAPDRVLELERWGALFDRTKDGLILQRDFGGHRYARLAHVGDRTGLEMIRTLQQHAVHQGIDVYMECTVQRLLKDGDRVAGASATGARAASSSSSRPRRSCSPPAASARSCKITSNSWEYTGDGHALALRAGADLIDMEFVQFHPTGMVWPPSVRGILVTEGVRGDGGTLKNNKGERFMFNYIPEFFKAETADNEAGGRPLVRGQEEQPPHARPPAARRGRPRDQRRGQGRPRQPPRRRLPRHRHAAPADYIQRAAALDVPPVQGAGRRRHHQGADGGRADLPLHDGRRAGGRRHDGDRRCPGLFAAGEVAGGMHGRQPAGRQLALRPARLRPARRALYAELRQEARARLPSTPARSRRRAREMLAPVERETAARTRTRSRPTSGDDAGRWSASSGPSRSCARRPRADRQPQAARRAVGVEGNRTYNPGWHLALDLQNAADRRRGVTRAALERKESRGGHTRDDYPTTDAVGQGQRGRPPAATGRMQVTREPLPEMPAELKALFEEKK